MLIIFDLDDTLIDTSGSITPHKLEQAICAMMEAGLVIDDFAAALKMIHDLNAKRESCSPSVLTNFLSISGYSQNFLPIGLAKLREPLTSLSQPVHVVPHALEMLEIVQKKYFLSVVTIGVPSLQLSKLKNAGIDPSVFSKIDVIEERNKKPSYRAIIDALGFLPQEVVVCGDRIAIDLVPAKELDCHTVHLAWGRGSHLREDAHKSASVDYTIDDWSGFAELLENLEKQTTLGHS